MRFASALSVLVISIGGLTAAPVKPPTALTDYVTAPDKSFEWKLKEKKEINGTTVYTLSLVSQTWHDVKWDHDLQVIIPKGSKVQPTMLLWNQGGSASPTNTTFAVLLAEKVGAPIAFLYGVPKQPLYVDKAGKLTTTPTNSTNDREGRLVEDALIAETFVRYLATQDASWPLLFPMVKSVVRTMDAVQAFVQDEFKAEVKQFVVTGASKRGWTSWLTAASGDKRVKAIAPMVIDTLNFPVQMKNQVEAFGKPSEMIADYTRAKLVPIPDTSAGKALWQMVDPYIYTETLTLPKMLIHGTNDPYWPQDALNTYWDDLKGDKYVCYVPNAGHNLRERDKDNKEELIPVRAVNTLAAFARSQIFDQAMPKLEWKYDKDRQVCQVVFNGTLKASRVWTADSDTRDFRKARWTAVEPVKTSGGAVIKLSGPVTQSFTFSQPEKGLRAAFVECECDANECVMHLTTQIQILEAKK
jgi:PhoPQ-activated pathogenicity-related protein